MRRRAIARVVVVIGIVIQVEEGNRITCSRSRGPTMSTSQEKTTLALLRRWSVPKKWTAGRSPQNEQIIVMHLRMNAWLKKKRRAARYTSSSLALWGATSSILGPSPSSTSSIATAPPPLPSDSAPFVFVNTNSTIQNALILQLLKLSRISLSDSCSSTSSDPS